MDCQEIETNKQKKNKQKKTEINKHDKYTTSLSIVFMSISRHKFNEKKYITCITMTSSDSKILIFLLMQ